MRMLLAPTLALFALHLCAQQTTATTTYKDSALNFTFTYPADFVDSGVTSAANTAGGPKGVTACLSTPLFAVRPAGGDEQEMLIVNRVDLGCMGETPSRAVLLPIAQNALQAGFRSVGTPVMLSPVAYTLDGHEAVFLQGSTPAGADTEAMYGGLACVLVEKTVLCSAALTAFPGHLPLLFTTPVSIAGHGEIPMVPPGKVVRPSGPDPKP